MAVRFAVGKSVSAIASQMKPPLRFSSGIDACSLGCVSTTYEFLRSRSYCETVPAADGELDPAVTGLPVPDLKWAETILAIPREKSGKSNSIKERRAGRVPSIVASLEKGETGGSKQLISVEAKQILRLLKRIGRSFLVSRTFDLEVRPSFDSEEVVSRERVLPRWVHLHAGTDRILNITFLRAPSDAVFNVKVPLLFRGEDACPGLRKGGYLSTIKRVLPYRCPIDHIPPYVEVDLSNLEIGDRVLMRELKVHPDVKLLYENAALPVCKIMGSRRAEEASTASA